MFNVGDKVKIKTTSPLGFIKRYNGQIVTLSECFPKVGEHYWWRCKGIEYGFWDYELELIGPKKKLTFKDFKNV